jgi:hypothetical protein
LTTEGGCKVKATLTRPTSGIASCDRVRALATIKAQCGTGDALAEVEKAWPAWKKLEGKKKKAQSTACTEQAATLESETATCASSGVRVVTGVPSCDLYLAKIESYLRCEKVPQAARDGARQGVDAMKAGWGSVKDLPEEARKAVADACAQAVEALGQGARAMGCSI